MRKDRDGYVENEKKAHWQQKSLLFWKKAEKE